MSKFVRRALFFALWNWSILAVMLFATSPKISVALWRFTVGVLMLNASLSIWNLIRAYRLPTGRINIFTKR